MSWRNDGGREWIGFLEMLGMISQKCMLFGGVYIIYRFPLGEDAPNMATLSRGAYIRIALFMGKIPKSSHI